MNNRIVRYVPIPEKIITSLQAAKTVKRIYPADEAAYAAIINVLAERIELGKKLHTLTISQVMSYGYSFQTARSAIRKLLEAGIIRLVVAHKFNPATGATFAGLYEINPDFIEEEAPTTHGSLSILWHQRGGDLDGWIAAFTSVQKMHERVTVDLLSEALATRGAEIAAFISKRGGRIS